MSRIGRWKKISVSLHNVYRGMAGRIGSGRWRRKLGGGTMRPIDGDRLMMHLADWWYSSFGQVENNESKAIKIVIDKIEQTIGEFALKKQSRIITVTDAEGGLIASISDKDIIEENGVHVIISEE